MNKRTEQTRWTPKRLLSLLMALIMTLSLLPTAAFADDNPNEWDLNNFKTTENGPESQVIVASGFFSGNARYALCINIDPNITYMPGDRVSVNAIAQLFDVDRVNQPLKIAISDQALTANNTGSTLEASYPFISNNESNIIVGKDGSISFNAGITYNVTVDGTTFADTKNVTVKINNLWTGYNVTYSKPNDASFIGDIPSDGKTKTVTVKNADTGEFEQEYTIPDNAKASRDGYTFKGWDLYRENSLGDTLGFLTQPGTTITNIEGDIRLRANLEENQTIKFNPVYSGVSGLPFNYEDISQGQTYTIPYTPELSGYDFKGWTVTGATLGADGVSVKNITSPITITPIWEKSDGSAPVGSHKVTFVRNNTTDGSALNWPSDLTGAKDSTVTIPWNIPQAEGYTFLGWSKDQNATTADPDYAYGKEVTIGDADISLYAVWQAKNYTISYTPDNTLTGVTLTSTAFSITPGRPASFKVTVLAAYDASSMIVAANGVPLGYSAKTEDANGSTTYTYSFVPTGDTAVTVSQPEQKSYVVTLPVGDHFTAKFDDIDKSDKTVTYNGSVSFTVNADSGWTIEDVSYTGDATLTHDATKYTLTNIKSNVAVSVKMKQIPVYTISYSIDEAYFTSQKAAGESTDVTLITPAERTGYNFDGWYKNPDYTDKAEATLTVTGDVNLYGRYTPKAYSIKYDLNAPTDATVAPGTIDATTKTYGQAVTLSAVKPTCDGYDFLGWAKARDSKTVVYAAGATVSEELTDNMTLYAVWAKKSYTITLQGGSGYTVSSNQALVVEHGSDFTFTVTVDGAYAATMPTVTANGATPTKVSGEPNAKHEAATYTYTISNVTADQVVTVKVTENARATVTFQYRVVDAQGNEVTVTGLSGETFMTQAVQLGDPAAQPQQPNIEGYKFVRWCGADHTTATTHTDYDFTKPVADELTIYAEITPILPVITVDALSGDGWKTENWKHGAEGTETTAAITNNAFTIAYGDNVTFDLVISEGYDYSKLSVTANGLALGYQSATTNTDGSTTLHYYLGSVMADTRIAITGIERKTITITYNANARDDVSGMPTPEKVKYYLTELGESGNDKITTQIPSRTGYEFVGWCTDSEATVTVNETTKTIESDKGGVVVNPGSTAPFTQDTTLYAIWLAQDTTLTLNITDVALKANDTRVIQYEGESITLQATLNFFAKGTVVFYKGNAAGTTGEKIGSTSINGKTAELTVTVGQYKSADKNEYYWVEFEPEADEGYVGSKSAVANVGILSKAIRWSTNTDASKLLIYKGSTAAGTPFTGSMVAGSTYTLKVNTDEIIGVEVPTGTQLVLGQDYKIVWQYYEVDKNDWTTVTESSDKDTYLVTGKYSGYQFRAQIVPLGPANGSKFIQAAKYEGDTFKADQYNTCLYTTPTDATALQGTTTTLEITGADDEAADVTINGASDVFTAAHLAQFEGKKVTLTATVKDTTTHAGVKSGEVKFFRYVDGTSDELLNKTLISVDSNGVATCEVEISKWTGGNVTDNKDEFYAVYQPNATYDTSASWTATTGKLEAVYIKSTAIQTPIIDSTLPGKLNGVDANSTSYDYDLTGLLAGVEHTFTLRQTGAAATADNQFSVVAKDGRTVAAENYDIEWQYKTNGNFAKADNDSTAETYTTKTTEVGDQYRVVLKAKGDMKTDATSKVAEIGKKQDVTVAVEASDEIKSTAETDVYQLNKITLTATVAAKETSSTMKPTGTVTFYYSVDGTNWTKIGEAKDLAEVTGVMTASIQTDQLPVKAGDNTKQNVEITVVYEGNETFNASATVNETEKSITAAAGCTTNNKNVTVYSSVVYVDSAENTTNTPGTHEIAITTEGGKVLANETNVNLKLSEVYTLDHATDAADKALLAYGTDYTVQWQMLSNAAAYPDKAADGTPWTNITSATGTTCQIDVVQGTAYRAVITVKDTPIAKGSYEKIDQGMVGTADKNDGRQVYYSNILVAANAPATLTVNVNTSNTSDGYEGIVEGETVTIHTFTSGATGTTPISQLTVNIYEGKSPAAGATPVFTAEKANVNGHVSFDWNKDVTPGYYTLKVKATFTNGYDDKEITRTLIVRDNDYSFNVTGDNAVYNGKVQGLNVAVQNMGIENALAQKSVVVYYYTDEARTQQVEPTQAGTYYATVRLQESAYWTEKTIYPTFTIKPREVSVVDLVAQAKVYDGTNNANIQEIILNDAEVDATTGLPTDGEGIIDGDSVYAVGTGYTSLATAGTAKLGVKDVSLKGDDAANYDLPSYSYTEDFNIQRSQVKGAIVSGRTYKYTGKDIKLAASDIYLIDQAGSQLTDYDVTYYYHNGDSVEKVDAMNKMGKYTVIARPEQDNYKGGATAIVYVGNTDTPGMLDNGAKSSLITISNTVKVYDGQATGVTATATKGTASASYYYDGAWKDTAPTAAGRYLVKATVTNGSVTDTAYGIYTIVKARPEFTPTTDKSSMEYTSGRYDGAIGAGFVNGKSNDTAETYITYTGGTIQGVAYEAPTEVGKYIATVHVGETANYTAHEKQVAFEITPKALTITADDISRQQYGAYPDLTASFKGLATGGIAADTSLRDVQIQPELIDDSNYTNDASDQVGNNYSITAVAALARNYDVSYVKGNMSVTREDPKPHLKIRGMIKNGDNATDLAYYGDVIQLYAYGNQSEAGVYNTSSILAWSVGVGDPATITQDGLLTVTGVGDVTVTLKRGIGAQQISTSLTFEAKKQEVKVVVPNQDLVYNGAEQKYDGGKFYAENAKGERITATPYMHDGKVKRTNVGSQIITSWVGDTNATYQSEKYCGLFTINVKDVSVTPNEISVIYGDTLGTPGYTPIDIVSGVPALTGGKAVSEREDYKNLDVLDGYEILVAGRENENYNVKYVTDQTAPDVKVTPKALIISTGTLDKQTGMTSGSLNPMGKYPVNGAAIKDPAPAMGPSNVRMYGEPNWVMDKDPVTLISGDTLADLTALNGQLVSFDYNIGADANVSYTDKSTKLTVSGSPMPDYKVFTDDSMMAFKNYTETYTLGTQNIYQRPVTLSVPSGMTLTAYKPSILDSSNQVKNDVLLNLLLNNLIVSKYNNEGGLAELLKHTIKDLNIQIKSTQVTGDKLTVKIALGNQNYWLNSANEQTFEITLVTEKIVPKYSTLDWTSFSVTMYDAEGKAPVSVNGAVNFYIFKKKDGADLKYSDYKNDPIIRSGPMTPTGSTGQYVASFERLPAGEYAYFAIAQNYTIVE